MVNSGPNSPAAAAAARARQDTGSNLLQELEALSQALYKASQAQNVVSGAPPAGPSPRKESHLRQHHHHHHLQQQQHHQPPLSPLGLRRRETLPARVPNNEVFGKNAPFGGGGGRKTHQVRHSISTRPAAPLYENPQEEQFKVKKPSRHTITVAGSRDSPAEDEASPAAAAAEPQRERKLETWHSQGFEKNLPEASSNFPEWLEDNMNFSKNLEAGPEKKKSIWNWKPFRTLSHLGHTRYNCLFTLHVHAIEGLPPAINGLRLTVHWRHKERAVQSMPCRVFQGSAEFEESLQLRCTVYGSKSAHQAVKFMPKAFTLGVVAQDVDELVLGQHRLDLSRLLPEPQANEYEDDGKPHSWTTSFKLSGKAKGGTLVVTFGYELLHKERGDRSGRFGSVMNSPFLSSPSLRSLGGGGGGASRSTHGTPRPRPSDGSEFFSPTISEPGDFQEYMTMEHLSLDEPPYSESGGSSSGSSGSSRGGRGSRGEAQARNLQQQQLFRRLEQKGSGFIHGESRLKGSSSSSSSFSSSFSSSSAAYPHPPDAPLVPHTPRQQREEPPAAKPLSSSARDRASPAAAGDSDQEEEDKEFVVVDQGVEVGALAEILHYPESRGSGNLDVSGEPADSLGRFSLDWPAEEEPETKVGPDKAPAGVAAEAEAEEIPAVRAVPAHQQQEEEEAFEDAVEEIRPWDPLGRFQQPRAEEKASAAAAAAPEGREEEEDRFEDAEIPEPLEKVDEGEEDAALNAQAQALSWDHQEEEEEQEQNEQEKEPQEEFIVDLSQSQHRKEEQDQNEQEKEPQEELIVDLSPSQHRKEEEQEKEKREKAITDDEVGHETVLWDAHSSPPTPSSAREEAAVKESHQEEEQDEMWSRSVSSTAGAAGDGGPEAHARATVEEDLDNEVDLIAGDFLSMLDGGGGGSGGERGEERGGGQVMGMSSDSENESPRALLLRQFEQEALLEGGAGLRRGTPEIPELALDGAQAEEGGAEAEAEAAQAPGWQSGEDDEELTSIMEAAESELQKATQTMRSKTRAKMLEDAETEALMQEWGLNEGAFQHSPPKPGQGFLDAMASQMVQAPADPPALAQGVGPFLQTKDGGMLRSMTPALFAASSASSGSQGNSAGKLVMQVSKPVVVPSEMGSSGLDIFRHLASGGVENMALQAMVAMPLEDITGKSVHQLAYESQAALEGPGPGQQYLPSNGFNSDLSITGTGRCPKGGMTSASMSSSRGVSGSVGDPSDEFVGLEELAPMAMQKIEALAVDGLKIQADMTDESAPYSVDALPWANGAGQQSSKFKRGGGVGSLDGVAAMRLLDARSVGDDIPTEADGLMAKVISIDEWMRLDAGQYDETDTKDETLAILAAHGAVHKDVVARGSREDRIRYLQGAKASANFGKGGFMGNTLTIAMLVQLRDPLRNNEPVGAPMMALVQAERVIVPPRPKVPRRTPSLLGNGVKWEEEEESQADETPTEPQFKLTALHVSGLKAAEEPGKEQQGGKKKTWGTQKQQQAGSRWLAANGMGKSSAAAGAKVPALRGKPQPEKKQGESLWSISSRIGGAFSRWRDRGVSNPHIRNPDVNFSDQKISAR